MPTGIRKSKRIRSSAYSAPSVNVRPSKRVEVRVSVLEKHSRSRIMYYGRLNGEFNVMDTQTIGAILEKIRTKLLEKYPVLVNGFVMQMQYYSPIAGSDMYDTTKVQIKPSMARGVKLSTLMPRGRNFSYASLYINSVKGATLKNMDRENPGISYRPGDVFRFQL